jgi:hypothetical protein
MLAFSGNGQLLASACSGARFVNVYSCADGHEAILRTLTLAGDPTALAIRSAASVATVVACCERSAVSVFQFSVDGSSSDLLSSASLELTQSNGTGACFLLAPRGQM